MNTAHTQQQMAVGVYAVKGLFRKIAEITDATCSPLNPADENDIDKGDTRDYVTIAQYIEQTLAEVLAQPHGPQREGFLRALADLFGCIADDCHPAGFDPRGKDFLWDPLKTTALAFAAAPQHTSAQHQREPALDAMRAALDTVGMARSTVDLLAALAGIEDKDSQKTGSERASMFNSALNGIKETIAPLPGLCDDAMNGDLSAPSLEAYTAIALIDMVGDVVWCSSADSTIPEPDYADIGRTLSLASAFLTKVHAKLQPSQRKMPHSTSVPARAKTPKAATAPSQQSA